LYSTTGVPKNGVGNRSRSEPTKEAKEAVANWIVVPEEEPEIKMFSREDYNGLGPVKEGRFLLPGNDRRPADVLIRNWVGGKDAALDVTVVTPLQDNTMPGAAHTAGHALTYAYERKINGAEEECRRQGIAFLPIVAETFGGWHPDAKREVKKLGAALARHTGQDEGEATSHLWSRMSILLQRGNAAILGNRIPNQPGAYIDGII